ncbi:MAG TPA: glycosyltransferase family 2 protein [Thermoanaerobaculia bacterium]|jgi:abequosyltransferase
MPPRIAAEPLLSICIPTYNFGSFIGATLDSILSQVTDERVEIVVVDGGSTDETEGLMRELAALHPEISYHRLPQKGGIDADMALSVELARGRYGWLFSADDIVLPGALDRVLSSLEPGVDVHLVETILCRFDLTPIRYQQNLTSRDAETFDLTDAGVRARYFGLAANTQAFFSFCGAVIVDRRRWIETAADERFMGSCWGHVARIFRMMPRGLRVRHLPWPASWKRGDNDSFQQQGLLRRIRIGIDGYLRIAEEFFGLESAEAAGIRRCLRAEYTFPYLLWARLQCDARELAALYARVHPPRVALLAIRFAPTPLLRTAYTLLSGLRKVRRGFAGG